MSDPLHSYTVANLWYSKEGPEFKEITRREIKAHFERHHKRFVRYSRLVKIIAPRNRKEERLIKQAIVGELPSLKPDYILIGEYVIAIVHIIFANPFHRTKSEDALYMSAKDIRRYIAFQSKATEQIGNLTVRTILLTNQHISLSYLKQLRHNHVVPVAITNSFLRTCLRTIRRKRSFKERWTHDNLYIKPSGT